MKEALSPASQSVDNKIKELITEATRTLAVEQGAGRKAFPRTRQNDVRRGLRNVVNL